MHPGLRGLKQEGEQPRPAAACWPHLLCTREVLGPHLRMQRATVAPPFVSSDQPSPQSRLYCELPTAQPRKSDDATLCHRTPWSFAFLKAG